MMGFLQNLVGAPLAVALAGVALAGAEDRSRRVATLDHLQQVYRVDNDAQPRETPVWDHWLRRSGELPPHFDRMPTDAFLPELLRFRNGAPVFAAAQWPARQYEIREILRTWAFGNWPPPPSRWVAKYNQGPALDHGEFSRRRLELWFAPSAKTVEFYDERNRLDYSNFLVASLGVELFVPAGRGPFPAIVDLGPAAEPLSHQDRERLKRGYVVIRYNRRDADLIPAVYAGYECNQLEWWAYAAGRCLDYLVTLPEVDKSRIAVAGHSRGGKAALLAATMDERFAAVINSHPGGGAGSYNPWRYLVEKYGGENLENSTRRFPYWNHPRLRFFAGRENKLPFDSHFLQALVAPRPALLGTGERDSVGQAWGDQQAYLAVKEVYQLLGRERNLGFLAVPGGHTVTPEMVQGQLDWLDMQFGRRPFDFPEQLIYTYTFEGWQQLTRERLDPRGFPERSLDDILVRTGGGVVATPQDWAAKADEVRSRIRRIVGEAPERARPAPPALAGGRLQIDEQLVAHLTYPEERAGPRPVVIFLHAYWDAGGRNWSSGYSYATSVARRLAQRGFLVVEFDQFGYGSRNRDSGIEFYRDHPGTSALAVMIQDVRDVVDAVGRLEGVDRNRIMVAGYSLGGMVALYAAAFDPRIHAVASVSGFGSMRRDAHGRETEGIQRYSHLRPTIPRLGLFLGQEARIPYDFHEVIALAAPRPVFLLAPRLDQDWKFEDVEVCHREAAKVYWLHGAEDRLRFVSPEDFNRFPPEYQEQLADWLVEVSR